MKDEHFLKGRGAQRQVANRFLEHIHELRDDFLEFCALEGEAAFDTKTRFIPVHPKTIVNKVNSPDVGMAYSMNPYQGCEHGCIYCYARNTHDYWGYGPGLDFERNILVKHNAPALLEAKLRTAPWQASTIVMSGNTDCYQPAEHRFQLTRQCLEIFLRYRHPVGIITKNALVLRDLDLLKALHKDGLVAVNISVTTLSEKTRRSLEPRTATIKKRLETIQTLSDAGIPVNAMLAPIIPGINSHELMDLAKTCAEHGARSFGFTIVRLNGAVGGLFTDWIHKAMPDRADKVLNQIKECHGGKLNDSRFGIRNRGEGKMAQQIHDMAKLAKRNYYGNREYPVLNTQLHAAFKNDQLSLFL